MKTLITLFLITFAFSASAQSLRSECENAYYATDYVKLHQYKVIVDWSYISDHAHVRLENIMYDNFDVLAVTEYASKSVYTIKENGSVDGRSYELLLEELKSITKSVSCRYNI